MPENECDVCGKYFYTPYKRTKVCSKECYKKRNRQRAKEKARKKEEIYQKYKRGELVDRY